MSSRVMGIPEPGAGPLDGPSPCPMTEKETWTGIGRGCPEEGPPASPGPGAGPEPGSGRGNPEGLKGMTMRRIYLVIDAI